MLQGITRSPFFYVALWATVSTGLYFLQWSNLYTNQARGGLVFITIVIVIFFGAAAIQRPLPQAPEAPALSRNALVYLLVYYTAAFAYAGGIPLLLITRGSQYDVYSFGLPYLHVPTLAFSGYYGLRCLDVYLAERDRRALLAYIAIALALLLIFSRSALSFLIFSSLVLYLMRRPVTIRRGMAFGTLGVSFVALFGYLGTERLNFQIAQENGAVSGSGAILSYGEANQRFLDLGLPDVFMWAYLYISSPIANLLAALQYSGPQVCGQQCDVNGLVVYSLIPDIAGDRLGGFLGIEKFDKKVFLPKSDLTASTVFGTAIGYAGLLGAIIMLLALLATGLFMLRVFSGTPVQAVGVTLLITMLFFCFFENMIAYSPLSLQLVFAGLAASRSRSGSTRHRDSSRLSEMSIREP